MQAYKPGSVLQRMLIPKVPIIYLLPIMGFINLPFLLVSKRVASSLKGSRIYLIFQPARFTLQELSLTLRWALTPPFHPYHNKLWRYIFCGTVCSSIKILDLSVRECGTLCCPDFPLFITNSDRPACTFSLVINNSLVYICTRDD